MTRKQALKLAVEALSKAGQTEAADILHKLSAELPFFRWSEDAIFDAVEQFILDHGHPPTVTDFKKRGLPPHTVVQRRFGVTLQEWLNQHYPTRKPSADAHRAQVTEAFVREYLHLRPVSAEDYDARRMAPARCWYTVARANHTHRWRGLLEKLELPVYSRCEVPENTPRLQVKVISDTDFSQG